MKKFKLEKSRTSLWRESKLEDELNAVAAAASLVGSNDCTCDAVDRIVDCRTSSGCSFLGHVCDSSDSSDSDIETHTTHNLLSGCSVVDHGNNTENVVGLRWLFDSDEDSDSGDSLVVQELAEWSITNNITVTATASLLSLLRPHLPFLPKSAQKLRSTIRNVSGFIKCIGGGEYCHVGLSVGLASLMKQYKIENDVLELQVNIDGIPLFKSSSVSLWPILCLVKNIPFKEPFVVGIFCGKEKPKSASEFLSDFVQEACALIDQGFTFEHQTKHVKIHSFVCDAPARAFVKGIKSPSGYSSCEKCTIRGEYDRKVIFPVQSCTLRTDDSFDAMTDEDHHVCPCPLKPLPIGFVSRFGLDYMHLVCLGVVRRILLYWKGPDGPLPVRLGRRLVGDLSARLLFLAQFVPAEFARKPRTLDELLRWKATEFREFLLYSSVVALRGIVGDGIYCHFMLLFVSIRLLASHKFCTQYCDYANDLLAKFVSDGKVLYGNDILVYNVHCLLHLSGDVRTLGCLEDFSAFTFESKLGQLKKLVRKPQQPLQQILRRLHEYRSVRIAESSPPFFPQLMYEHCDGPLVHGISGAVQYKRIQTSNYVLSLSHTKQNNCILIKGDTPAVVRNILKTDQDIILLCSNFHSVEDAFALPLPSSRLQIFTVSGSRKRLVPVSFTDIACKCACFPVFLDDSLTPAEDTFVFVPLLHSA